jgi:hypothetical protein
VPSVIEAECVYSNHVPDEIGASVGAFLLTGQAELPLSPMALASNYRGVRLSFNQDSYDTHNEVSIGTDYSSGEPMELWFRVAAAPVTEPQTGESLLESAHSVLLERFVNVIPESLLRAWGWEER